MSWPTEALDTRRLGIAALGAVVLHAAVILIAAASLSAVAPQAVPTARPMAARLAFTVMPAVPEAATSTAEPAVAQQHAPPPTPQADTPAAASAVPATGRSYSPDASGDEFAGYLPRRELTAPASPRGPVYFPFPEDVKGTVDLRVQVTVFIDESGAVRHVRMDTPDVHPAFAQAIRDSLQGVRFEPGKLNEDAVRSRLRLEVEFSNLRR